MKLIKTSALLALLFALTIPAVAQTTPKPPKYPEPRCQLQPGSAICPGTTPVNPFSR